MLRSCLALLVPRSTCPPHLIPGVRQLRPMNVAQTIWLNGTSSSGKTTLATALQDRLTTPFLHAQIDTFLHMLPQKTLENDQLLAAALPSLVKGFHESVRALMDCGTCVIVDHVLQEAEWLMHCVSLFENRPVLFVGVHCSLSSLEERERRRGDRTAGQAKSQLPLVHRHEDYDVEVDTSRQTVDECVSSILDALTNGVQPTAFERLRIKLGKRDA